MMMDFAGELNGFASRCFLEASGDMRQRILFLSRLALVTDPDAIRVLKQRQ